MGQKHGVESSGQGRGEIVSGSSPFDDLPKDCISNIISFTSPRDACVAASVSKTFKSAVNSDSVWKKFLPPDYYSSLVPQSRDLSSNKELYFALCDNSALIDHGKKSFWLEKASGKRCIMLSPKQLAITYVYDPRFWQWISTPESRFVKVPMLLLECSFDIHDVMNTRMLSHGTLYSVYIVYKTSDRLHGFQRVGLQLCRQGTSTTKILDWIELMKLEERGDGWKEIEIGEFFNEGRLIDCHSFCFNIGDLKHSYWNSGLIIQGIEIRPVEKSLANQFGVLARIFQNQKDDLDKFSKVRTTILRPFPALNRDDSYMQAIEKTNHGVESSRGEGGGEIVSGSSSLVSLPEDCISNIISFTSPQDTCVAASVSKTFGSAVQSDIIWEKFLPQEYASLFHPSRIFSSKKELYFALCNDSVLIDDGKMSFWLEKASGKRCVMLSAKQLEISSGNNPQYWQWISIPESRFEKIAQLLKVCRFEIRAGMHTRYLSPGTRYSVFIVFKTENECPGLGDVPVEVGVRLVGQESPRKFIYFVGRSDRWRETERRKYVTKPEERVDGWMEAELGEFFNESCCDDISVSVVETKSPYWKRGLIIQGIEFRPAKSL